MERELKWNGKKMKYDIVKQFWRWNGTGKEMEIKRKFGM